MLLKNRFYTVESTSTEGNAHKFVVKIDANHSIFKGHFPQQPVVPGVCTIQMLKECVSDLLGKCIRYTSIPSCKFISSIIPSDDAVELSIVVVNENTFQAVVSLNGAVMLKMKANYTEQ